MTSSSSSILRKRGIEKASNKRNVSFATGSKVESKDSAPPLIGQQSTGGGPAGNHHSILSKKQKGVKNNRATMMNEEEEDIFDPKLNRDSVVNLTDGKSIRDARSKRAIDRVTTGHAEDFDTVDHSSKLTESGVSDDVYDGEEITDERYSLLNEEEDMDDLDKNNQKSVNNINSIENKKDECPVEPFNMASERDDGMGYFDGDTYVFRRNRGEEEDAWLDSLNGANKNTKEEENEGGARSLDSMMLNKNGKKDKDQKIEESSNSISDDSVTKEKIYDQLILLLASNSETVIQALGRYGAIIKREKKKKSHSSATVTDSASKKALNLLTELSNVCMMKFDDHNIYDHNREYFQIFLTQSDASEAGKRKRKYFEEGSDGVQLNNRTAKRSKDDTSAANNATTTSTEIEKEIKWEYKGNQDGSIHGPFTTKQMVEWIQLGFFVGGAAVDVRVLSTSNQDETKIKTDESGQEVVDDLLGDLEDSDDDDCDNETKTNPKEVVWMRSDKVDFTQYL
uniref:GYF domain-containing protein n=1 Tax=Chaetoceros debilis TaxID=122233 RepID=A0A7S3VH66_9STRA|mmetsp:Transcript_20445/g.31026  ORF Transcript_20445/g.31026 Transcript_20445/m.31026 type:complete len:510 (-) Transcript_20445:177-1706(-)|eukprot:CAMPEP_0194094698 /NCGR_PEP_ID=MMETSP0149-20130528/55149_1 /TAXON_ID=122233 /ORGANISM="Chaetoceros debilis, Strain MM31A-1" /LENGTH=509 /DNA_ID=CAMNT_0038780481 /DNA_START=16 /DNA_END=1545 /DNA_ORIENTATION=-